jgi:hypothetical protein
MPNLINEHEDNVFYNYRTRLVLGESLGGNTSGLLNTFLAQKLGSSGVNWFNSGVTYGLRFAAPGLEMKTANITTTSSGAARAYLSTNFRTSQVNSNNTVSTSGNYVGEGSTANVNSLSSDVTYAIINSYSLIYCSFNSTFTTIRKFVYLGWLREPSYTGTSVGVRGLACLYNMQGISISGYVSPTAENATGATTLSTADNAITNPAITCSIATPGADWSDIVIRDNSAPNNAIGKLYNCISVPNSFTVGQIIKNTGVDPETGLAYTSANINKYRVVMPWGGRMLAMRVWSEGYT